MFSLLVSTGRWGGGGVEYGAAPSPQASQQECSEPGHPHASQQDCSARGGEGILYLHLSVEKWMLQHPMRSRCFSIS